MNRSVIKMHAHLEQGVMQRAKEILRGASERVHQHRVSVGVHETEGEKPKNNYEGKTTASRLVDIMTVHEFGGHTTIGGVDVEIPERSWLRSWFDQNLSRLKSEATEAMRAEYRGDAKAIERAAAKWHHELADWIANDEAGLVPLSAITVAKRVKAGLAEGPPLFATGQFVAAIRALADGEYVS